MVDSNKTLGVWTEKSRELQSGVWSSKQSFQSRSVASSGYKIPVTFRLASKRNTVSVEQSELTSYGRCRECLSKGWGAQHSPSHPLAPQEAGGRGGSAAAAARWCSPALGGTSARSGTGIMAGAYVRKKEFVQSLRRRLTHYNEF